jgi:hypothetical protein
MDDVNSDVDYLGAAKRLVEVEHLSPGDTALPLLNTFALLSMAQSLDQIASALVGDYPPLTGAVNSIAAAIENAT